MKIKNNLKKLMLVSMIFMISIFLKNDVLNAEELNENGVFITSENVSKDVVNYGKKIFSEHVKDNKTINKTTDNLYLCEPFLMSSNSGVQVYDFLIKDDINIISELLVIRNNNNLTWQINSGKTSEKFNKLSKKSGVYEIKFKSDDNEVDTLIINKLVDKNNVENKVDITRTISKINLDRDFNINNSIIAYDVDYPTPYPNSRILPMNPKETQGNVPWCSAYAGARILSYELSKDIRARDILEWCYPNKSYSELKKLSISDSQLINYARSRGSYPKYVNYALSRYEIMDEIIAQRMIYAGCKNVDTGVWHAMVVYGYEKDKSYYVWNPWGEYYTRPMHSSDIYTNSGRHYYWEDSIKNWTW